MSQDTGEMYKTHCGLASSSSCTHANRSSRMRLSTTGPRMHLRVWKTSIRLSTLASGLATVSRALTPNFPRTVLMNVSQSAYTASFSLPSRGRAVLAFGSEGVAVDLRACFSSCSNFRSSSSTSARQTTFLIASFASCKLSSDRTHWPGTCAAS